MQYLRSMSLASILLAVWWSLAACAPSGSTTVAATSTSAPGQAGTVAPAATVGAGAGATAQPTAQRGVLDLSNPCSLVTKAEAAAALGAAVNDGESFPFPAVAGPPAVLATCQYNTPTNDRYVQLIVQDYRDPNITATVVRGIYEQLPGRQRISGLGDFASWGPDDGNLLVIKGRTVLIVEVYKDSADMQQAQTIARAAVGRIP